MTYRFGAIYGFFGGFDVIFVSHAWLHENFTEYDVFWFDEAGERVSFDVFVISTIWFPVLHDFHVSLRSTVAGECFVMIALARFLGAGCFACFVTSFA